MGFPGGTSGKEHACQCSRHKSCRFDHWVGKIPWRRAQLPIPVFLGFPCGSVDKESACNAGDLGLITGLGRSPGEGKGFPLQYSGLHSPWGHKESDTREQLNNERAAKHYSVALFSLKKKSLTAPGTGGRGKRPGLGLSGVAESGRGSWPGCSLRSE